MKHVINEKTLRNIVKKIITEAMMPGFSFDELKGKSFAAKLRYCQQMFGRPIGSGSSRVVYQIDDQWVFKLAKNRKGIAQNEEECSIATDNYGSDLSLNVDEDRSDTENYEWLVSEFALPAKQQDFKKIYGIDWKDIDYFATYIKWCNCSEIYDKYRNNEKAIDFLEAINDYAHSWDGAMGDVARIANWGMVMREGSPDLVLLDMGASDDIVRRFYTHGFL